MEFDLWELQGRLRDVQAGGSPPRCIAPSRRPLDVPTILARLFVPADVEKINAVRPNLARQQLDDLLEGILTWNEATRQEEVDLDDLWLPPDEQLLEIVQVVDRNATPPPASETAKQCTPPASKALSSASPLPRDGPVSSRTRRKSRKMVRVMCLPSKSQAKKPAPASKVTKARRQRKGQAVQASRRAGVEARPDFWDPLPGMRTFLTPGLATPPIS